MKWQQHCAGEPGWCDSGVCVCVSLQNVPVTMAFVTMGCKGTGAASASQAGWAPPAKKVRECEGQRNLRDPVGLSEQLCLL